MHSSKDLSTFIATKYPLLWINTLDYHRMLDEVVGEINLQDNTSSVYMIDNINGLSMLIEGVWKPVLYHYTRDDMYGPVINPTVIASIVKDTNATLVSIGNPAVIDKFTDLIIDAVGSWRSNTLNDNSNDHCQFIFIGPVEKDKVSPFLTAMAWTVGSQAMDAASAQEFYTQIASTNPDIVEAGSIDGLTRHSAGFSEYQSLATTIKSVSENGKITESFVEEERRNIIGSSGILEVQKPRVSIDQIGGLENAKKILSGNVWLNQNKEEAQKLGLSAQNRILLIGVPGTGKSALCEATASMLNYDMVKFGVSKMMNKFVGQSEENMRSAFAQVNAMTPVVLWVDELGRDLSGSHTSNDGGTTDRTHGELLTGIQELNQNNLLMAAANRIDGLPPEMLRADRFDRIMFVGFPSAVERLAILSIYLPEAPEESLASLLGVTESFTGAEMKAAISDVRFNVGVTEHRPPNINEIGNAFKTYKNRVWLRRQDEIVQMYKIAFTEWDWASDQQHEEARHYISKRLPSAAKAQAPKKISI